MERDYQEGVTAEVTEQAGFSVHIKPVLAVEGIAHSLLLSPFVTISRLIRPVRFAVAEEFVQRLAGVSLITLQAVIGRAGIPAVAPFTIGAWV